MATMSCLGMAGSSSRLFGQNDAEAAAVTAAKSVATTPAAVAKTFKEASETAGEPIARTTNRDTRCRSLRLPIDPRAAIDGRIALGFAVLVALHLAPPASAQTSLAGPLAPPPRLAGWQPLIAEASARFGVPIPWIERVMALESAGRTQRNGLPIRSKAGAMGLMQLMPATWAKMRGALGLGDDPDDPRDNIMAGTAYLRLMYDRFGYPGLFAAYNAGPARYAASLATGRPLPVETRNYLLRATAGTVGPDPGGEDPARLVRLGSTVFPTGTAIAALSPPARAREAGLFFARTHVGDLDNAAPSVGSKPAPTLGRNPGPAPSLFALRRAQP